MEKVSIIIVNYNGRHYLKTCLPSLYQQTYRNIEVIVVDNASHDGSVEWMGEHYPQVRVIESRENVGFAQGNNLGYKKATGEFILFLNNDTKVTKRFLLELVDAMHRNPEVGGVQSKLLLMDHPERLDAIGAFFTPTGFLYHYAFAARDLKKYDTQIHLYTVKGACMMFRSSVLRQTALHGVPFDKKYFAYFEETDLCHRVLLAGYQLLYVPESIIFHKMGGTSVAMKNAFVQYHSFKNRINSYMKNLDMLHVVRVLPLHIALCELFSVVSLLKGNFPLALAVQKAFWWNLVNAPETLRDRHTVQSSIRKVADEKFLAEVQRNPPVKYFYYLALGKPYFS